MLSGYELNRINNVAARVVIYNSGAEFYHRAEFYHPDCLAEVATKSKGTDHEIDEENVQIDHEYCGGDGRFTHWDDICAGCDQELGDSGGVQPEDDHEYCKEDEEDEASLPQPNGAGNSAS